MEDPKFLKRGFWQRVLGIPATGRPADPDCWSYSSGQVVVDLGRAPELSQPAGAIRLEGQNLPERILVVHGEDGRYRAFVNRCRHMGRRLDPVPGENTVQCCSVGKSTYDYDGKLQFGPSAEGVSTFVVKQVNDKLFIAL
jgi:nitrite reductase/ring-hydroxylating ferredoxin subunit